MTNPYWGKNFFEFFLTLGERVVSFFRGEFMELAPDEVQLLVLSLTAISCALLGTFLVLRRMAMIANALSHTLLLGIVAVFLLFAPLLPDGGRDFFKMNLLIVIGGAFFTAVLTAFFIQVLHRCLKLQEDASIGLVFTILFAIGILVVTLYTRNLHIGTEVIMGNVDALHRDDLNLAGWIAGTNFLTLFLFYRGLKITSFDPVFARSMGISTWGYEALLLFLTAGAVIGAFRAVGVILVLSFLVGPVLIARLLTHRLNLLLFLSCLIGIFCGVVSVALSRHILSVSHIPLSTAGIAVTLLTLLYFTLLVQKTLLIDKGIKRS